MAKLNKDTTQLSGMQVNNNVSAIQPQNPGQNSVNKLATPDPNYASVRQTYETPKSEIDTRGLAQQFVEDVIKPYGEEDIKLSPMPKLNLEEIRPEDTFEETAGGWNYNYDRAVSQAQNQQGGLNALQGTGHVAGIQERPELGQLREQQLGRNVSDFLMPTGIRLEGLSDTTTPTEASSTGADGGFNGGTVAGGKAGTTTSNQRQLKNADVNFSQYGDDSSAPNQATMGGQNEKYTGDFVKNSNLGYDPNIRTADLDPSYMFGMDAQWANTDAAGYIARRNDMIASALFNDAVAEGRLPTKDDVINYLAQQEGRMNSTEADRFNTIESIWKRLGGLSNQAQGPDLSNVGATYSDTALNNMENDLNKSTAGELYGKVTADQDTHIKTLEDDNSVYKVMNESRINAYKQLRGMDSQAIAASIVSGVMATDSQSMRDLMQYDPDKYQYVMQAVKQMRGQQNINSITNGNYDFSTNIGSNSTSEITSFASENSNALTSTSEILSSVNSTLSSNQAATTAEQTMADIEKDMVKLKNRLKNLSKEANTVFKGDVPDYMVKAYIANRTAEIQNEMGMLEERYNAAYSRYQTEWEKVKREKEFDLKKEELELKKTNATWDQYMDEQGLALKYAEATGDTSSLNRNLMRTERNNNPTAMTTDVAKSLGLVEGVDYTIGDPFQSGSGTLYTAKLLGDPIETTIKALDTAASTGRGAFYTKGGKQRRSHTAMSDAKWLSLSNDEKRDVILNMLKREGGNIDRMAAYGGGSGATSAASGTFTRRDGEKFSTTSQYAALSDKDRDTVEGLLNLQIDPSTLQTRYGYDKGQAQKLINAAASINPEWTQNSFKEMRDVQKSWSDLEMKGANDKNATAMTIAKELYDSLENLGNKKLKGWNEMVNYVKTQLSDVEYAKFLVNLNTFVSETASAMKGGNAAATDQDKQDFKEMFSPSMGKDALQAMVMQMANNLYGKNETQANFYGQKTLTKPNPIWTNEITDRMYDTVGITNLTEYYNYQPDAGRYAMGQALNNLSNDEMVNNIFSY